MFQILDCDLPLAAHIGCSHQKFTHINLPFRQFDYVTKYIINIRKYYKKKFDVLILSL